MKPTTRFSSRASNYASFRPSYPPELIDALLQLTTPTATIADIGSGTGILTELLLQKNLKVLAIEPNTNMRQIAETTLNHYTNFSSINAPAEATTLESHSIDLITVAQAFHWFDQAAAKQEFLRILKPNSHIAIIWNLHALITPFDQSHETLKQKFGKDYTSIRKSHEPDLTSFFEPLQKEVKTFPHQHTLNKEGYLGLIFSSSFMPSKEDADYEQMLKEANEIFDTYQQEGLVTVNYNAVLHYNP